MNKDKKIVIIGAGPCGLGAAWRLHELGYTNFVVYEQYRYAGGLATSFLDTNGFTWDIGGHVIHSHYEYFDGVFEEVMRGEYSTIERESWIWLYDRFIPYPFQLNIRYLPKAVLKECLAGLDDIKKQKSDAKHFLDWINRSFGYGIAKHFMVPFNEKVWAYPLSRMNTRWVGDRVATVDIKRVRENIDLNKDDISWGPNHVFKFPAHGGTGEIWKRVSERFLNRVMFGKSAVRVDGKKRVVYFQDGSKDAYDMLFSTMPIDMLSRVTSDTNIPSPGRKLHRSGVYVIGLGIHGKVPERLATKCWIYFPDKNTPFFRATVFSNYAASNSPPGTWSLMCEVSTSMYTPIREARLMGDVIEGARRSKLIALSDEIIDTFMFFAPYGYPTPTLKRDQYIHAVLPELEKYGIYSRGRFGVWKYEISNQDHTFMQGVEWANKFLNRGEEITVSSPSLVNQKV